MPNNFIIGVWFQPASSFSKWVGRGVNTLIGYESEGNPNSFYASTWKPAAIAAGLKYIVPWKDPRDGTHTAPGPLTAADNSDPNLLAVSLPDEPDGAGNLSPGQCLDMYNAIKAVLPSKPVFLNFDGWKTQWRPACDYRCYAAAADWLSMDYHICNHGDGAGPDGLKLLSDAMDRVIQAGTQASGAKKYLSCIEAAYEGLDTQDWVQGYPDVKRKMHGPSSTEMTNELNTLIARPLSGIFWFPDEVAKTVFSFDNMNADQIGAMTALNLMLKNR
jgi:hypothetical protein